MSTLITTTVQGVQNIKYDASTTAMTIDSVGRVLMPAQPSFFTFNMNFPSGTSGVATGGTIDHNIGSHYNSSNGKFTAPITGRYMFIGASQYYSDGSNQYQTSLFVKNGTGGSDGYGANMVQGLVVNGGASTGNNHASAQISSIFSLSANDTIALYTEYGGRDIQNYFGGYLIG